MNRTQLPWWLEEGSETCPFCEMHLNYEAVVYCADCDRPVCPVCLMALMESHSALCPECYDERGPH